MLVETDDVEVAGVLRNVAGIIGANDGFISEALIIRERGGDLSCAVAGDPGELGTILVDYPHRLCPPMHAIEWSDHPDRIEPIGGHQTLDPVQRALLDEWVALVNLTGKLDHVRQVAARVALPLGPLRDHLATGGFPDLRRAPDGGDPLRILTEWHSTLAGPGDRNHIGPAGAGADHRRHPSPAMWLIPLKAFANHHPDGADQRQAPGRVMLRTGATSSHAETHENYGDIDAMQQVLVFGYVDRTARVVHSIPVEVDGGRLGAVRVSSRAKRRAKVRVLPDVPAVRRDENGILAIGHLTIRPDNRHRLRSLMAMLYRSQAGLGEQAAGWAADDLLGAVVEANLRYYAVLEAMLTTPDVPGPARAGLAGPHPVGPCSVGSTRSDPMVVAMLRAAAALQVERIRRWWG